MNEGRRTGASVSIEEARARFEADLAELPASARDLAHPVPPAVGVSPRLAELDRDTREHLLR